jgi:SAM-dependent methyltransferase
MSQWISLQQRLISGILAKPDLFAFTRVEMGPHGNAHPRRHAWQIRFGKLLGPRLFSLTYPGVPGRVHIHDTMLVSESHKHIRHYIPRRITACDIDPEAVRFLAQEFGARPLLSTDDFAHITFPAKYEVIWAGSLFTHLPAAQGRFLLDLLTAQLRPGGLLLFSTQGLSCLDHLALYGPMFANLEGDYRRQIAEGGSAYADYDPAHPGYGIAVYNADQFRRALTTPDPAHAPLRFISHATRGWDNHQDLWAFQLSE